MSLKRRVIPSVLNGVSKQPALLRASDQNEDELNTWSSMANGLAKRPPSEFVAKLTDTVGSDAYIHYINRDVTERYCVVIDDGAIKVYDVETGAEKTVNAPHGYGYLAGSTNFRAVTVADYTFIVNADMKCELDAEGADLVAAPTDYLWLNRTGADAANLTLAQLRGLSAIPGSYNQYSPNVASGSYAGELASIDKLPETAANGTLYKISGSVESGFVSYYVVRNGAVWDETVGPNQTNSLNAATMPHALVSNADGTFTFAPFSWAPRRVGDADSNPAATFVGKTISDVFFYQNRLGFLVDENLVFSCSGDFGNFWRTTVLDYISSDIVDIAVTTANVALLKYAVTSNDGIMAFADQTQFSIENGEDGLSPSSASITPVTNYEMNINVRPVNIGTEVYFCGDQNGSSIVWEYTRLEQGDSLVAAEISAHVPGFIPARLRQLVAAPNAKALFAISESGDVYVYQFYWNGNEKIQSAWRKWEFDGTVLAGKHMDDSVFFVVSRDDGVHLVKTNLEEGALPAHQNHEVFLDMRTDIVGTYDALNDWTEFTFPYEPRQDTCQLIRTNLPANEAPGSLIDPSQYAWPNATTVRVPGSEERVTAGETFRWHVTFSQQFPLDYQGRPVTTGRLQLRTFTVNYADTGFFTTEVAPYGSAMEPNVEEVVPALLGQFTGKIVGADTLRANEPAYHTGSYSFQVYGDAAQATITIANETHVASTIVSAEWEGFTFNRASQ